MKLRGVIKEQLTANDAEISKIATVRKGKPKLVIFDSFGSFTKEIADRFDGDFTVVVAREFNPSLAWWGDTVWFDFCDQNIREASRMAGWEQQIICRVHGFEAYDTDIPAQVNWENVDDLVFVSEHTKSVFLERFPEAEKATVHVIPNGIDLSKWTYKKRSHGNTLGYAGYLKAGKNPSMLLQILNRLPEEYRLNLAGEWQNEKEQVFFEHLVRRTGLTDRVSFEPLLDDMNGWLDEIDYLVSTSISESFSYVIGEAMAKGIKPVIIDRPGVEELWGEEFLFRSVDEAAGMILPDSNYDSKSYSDVAAKYSLNKQMEGIEKLLRGRKA